MRDPRHFGAMADELYQRAAPLLEAEIDREIIALDRERGEVFGFNSVASDVWRLLDEPKTAGDLSRALREIYDVPPERCAEELDELLKKLVEMQLVARIPAA